MSEDVRWTRLRWRLRGATMWPAFAVGVIVDAALLHALPIAGETAPEAFGGILLAFFFNLVAVAIGAPLAGRWLRRRRPGLPKVVADDRAGTALVAALSAGLLAAGLAHRAADRAERGAFPVQAHAAREFVRARAPARFRANAEHLDTWRQGP